MRGQTGISDQERMNSDRKEQEGTKGQESTEGHGEIRRIREGQKTTKGQERKMNREEQNIGQTGTGKNSNDRVHGTGTDKEEHIMTGRNRKGRTGSKEERAGRERRTTKDSWGNKKGRRGTRTNGKGQGQERPGRV